jgi:hypothetical protein
MPRFFENVAFGGRTIKSTNITTATRSEQLASLAEYHLLFVTRFLSRFAAFCPCVIGHGLQFLFRVAMVVPTLDRKPFAPIRLS